MLRESLPPVLGVELSQDGQEAKVFVYLSGTEEERAGDGRVRQGRGLFAHRPGEKALRALGALPHLRFGYHPRSVGQRSLR